MFNSRPLPWLLAGLFLLLVAVLMVNTAVPMVGRTPRPTITPEPLRPTRTPLPATPEGASAAVLTPPVPTATPVPPADPLPPTPVGEMRVIDSADFQRFGVSGGLGQARAALEIGLPFTQFISWGFSANPRLPDHITVWQMIRVNQDGFKSEWEPVQAAARARPGSVWVIGNEPDVRWQDNVTPEVYAERYHEAWTRIREADPTARIAPAGVAQATPLRLAWLDAMLQAYQEKYGQPLSADHWTLHTYILREEADSWGVDIPPGLDVRTGELYEIEDHDRIDLFEEQLVRFRAWMAANGYQELPLSITEFGILLPNDYGFPPERIAEFMGETFDLMRTLRGPDGMPGDDNRYVQTWFWYSLEDSPDYYPTSNLISQEAGELTFLGQAWRNYLLQLFE